MGHLIASLGVWALAACCAAAPDAGEVKAEQESLPKLISLDYCADQLVLGLADRTQILALSPDADKPFSHLRDAAVGLRQMRASGEDVLALKPDLVVRSWGGSPRDLAFYSRFGIETVQIGYATNLQEIADVLETVGAALGQPDRTTRRIAKMYRDVAFAAGEAPPLSNSPTVQNRDPSEGGAGSGDHAKRAALYIAPGGVTGGRKTLVGTVMAKAGLANAAKQPGWHALPLETLVHTPPNFAVTAFFETASAGEAYWSPGHHPVMRALLAEVPTASLTETRITCPTWLVAEEARDLAHRLGEAK